VRSPDESTLDYSVRAGERVRSLTAGRGAALGLILLAGGHVDCAGTGHAPDRSSIAAALRARTGVDTGTLAPPCTWTPPPGLSLDDGMSQDEAVAAALWNNADFHAALAELGLARADLIEAGMLRNPILALLFPWGPKQLEATLSWPVEALWLRPRKVEAARLVASAVAERLVAHGLDLIAEVRLAHVAAATALEREVLAETQARLGGRLSELAAGRLLAGDISALEAQAAQNDALRLRAMHQARVHERDLALLRLRTLVGLPAEAGPLRLEPADRSAEAPSYDLAALTSTALAARPDVRAAELDVEAAAARAGLERARVLAVTAILDANNEGREGFEAGPGLGLELPLFSQNRGGRARAAAELERAGRRYLAVRARVVAAVENALTEFRAARDAERVWRDEILPPLTLAQQRTERTYTAGEISLLATLDVQRRLLEAQDARLDAAAATESALVRLAQAVGADGGRDMTGVRP